MEGENLARGLGWFSIALGLTEAVATNRFSMLLGMENRAGVIRLFGLRELATGVAIESQPHRAVWLWARVGGDALDLAVLSAALKANNPKRRRVGIAIGAVAAVTVLDIVCAQQLRS